MLHILSSARDSRTSLTHSPPVVTTQQRACNSRQGCLGAMRCAENVPVDLELRFAAFVSQQPQPQIILGTQSASRRSIVDELAQKFNFKCSAITADIDERAIRKDDPEELVLVLAHAKADAIVKKLKDSNAYLKPGYLVTCDQVVVHEGNIREKPLSSEEARTFIHSYGRSPAVTVGACVCACLDTGVVTEDVDVSTVHFAPLPERAVDALIAEGSVFIVLEA